MSPICQFEDELENSGDSISLSDASESQHVLKMDSLGGSNMQQVQFSQKDSVRYISGMLSGARSTDSK